VHWVGNGFPAARSSIIAIAGRESIRDVDHGSVRAAFVQRS
jgi:hypothetical protein